MTMNNCVWADNNSENAWTSDESCDMLGVKGRD